MTAQTRRWKTVWGDGPLGGMAGGQRKRGQGWSFRTWNRPVWLQQIMKYSIVGTLNTALDATLYLVLTHWLGLGAVKVLAKGISYTACTVNSFHWNRSWTFQSTARVATTFLPFALASLAALAINAGAMYVSLELFDEHELPALVVATGTSLLWNFAASKLLVFRR